MKLNTKIILIGVLSLLFFVFAQATVDSFFFTFFFIKAHAIGLSFALALIVLNVVFKVFRTYYLINYYSNTTFRIQFRGISIGYFFDLIFPFKLGQVFRAYFISYSSKISFGYSFLAIIIEKIVDVFFMIIVIFLLKVFVQDVPFFSNLTTISLSVIILTLFVFVFALALRQQEKLHSRILSSTKLLNENISNRIRYSIWSSVYGFQKIIRDRKFLLKYFLLTVASWLAFVGGVFVLIREFSFGQKKLDSVFAIFFEHNLFAGFRNAFFNFFNPGQELNFSIQIVYRQLAYPIFVVLGFFFLVQFLLKFNPALRIDRKYVIDALYEDSFSNKNIFITNYFANDPVYISIHRELSEDRYSVEKFFSGGSEAITLAVRKNNQVFVRKCVALDKAEKLRAQYVWLNEHELSEFVEVYSEGFAKDYYYYDMKYLENHQSFFDYIHRVPIEKASTILNQIYETLLKRVYVLNGVSSRATEFNQYLQTNLFAKSKEVSGLNPVLKDLFEAPKLCINGIEFDGFKILLNKVLNSSDTMASLSRINSSERIHGDITIDNVLVDGLGEFVIIDPSDDNVFSGPFLDAARTMQSLKYGYEFLIRDSGPVKISTKQNVPTIDFTAYQSVQYGALQLFFLKELVPKILTTEDLLNLDFHIAVLYFRMLPHQNRISKNLSIKFFATGIMALSQFVETRGL